VKTFRYAHVTMSFLVCTSQASNALRTIKHVTSSPMPYYFCKLSLVGRQKEISTQAHFKYHRFTNVPSDHRRTVKQKARYTNNGIVHTSVSLNVSLLTSGNHTYHHKCVLKNRIKKW
jgi:spermidine synthase